MGKWVESNKASGVDGGPTTLRSDYIPNSGLLRSGRNVEVHLSPIPRDLGMRLYRISNHWMSMMAKLDKSHRLQVGMKTKPLQFRQIL
jgi:hypothetical protein